MSIPGVLLAAVLLGLSVARPIWGLLALAGLLPLAGLLGLLIHPVLGGVETLLAPVLIGALLRLGLSAKKPPARPWPAAGLLAAIVVAATAIDLSLEQQRTARLAVYLTDLRRYVTSSYFSDLLTFAPLHAGAVWVGALVLAVLAERVVRQDPAWGAKLARVLVIGAAAAAAFSIVRLLEVSLATGNLGSTLARYVLTQRITPLHTDVNAAGSFFALFGVPAVWLCVGRRNWWRWGLPAACLLMALWLTQSRTAQVAFVAAAVLVWLVARRPSRRAVAVVGAVAVLGLLVGVIARPARTAQTSSASAMVVRVEMAKIAFRIAATHPVFGVGLGSFRRESIPYVPPALAARFRQAAQGENAHNNFLQILAELGTAGLAAFLWFLWAPLHAGWRSLRAGDATPELEALFGGVAAFLISCLGGHPLLTSQVLVLFCFATGVLFGLARVDAAGSTGGARPALAWIAIGLVLISLPVRAAWTRYTAVLDRVAIGAGPAEDTAVGKFRRADPVSWWYVPAGVHLVIVDLRVETTAPGPCLVEVAVDGRSGMTLPVRPDDWQQHAVPLTKKGHWAGSHQIEFRTPAGCQLLVGRIEER